MSLGLGLAVVPLSSLLKSMHLGLLFSLLTWQSVVPCWNVYWIKWQYIDAKSVNTILKLAKQIHQTINVKWKSSKFRAKRNQFPSAIMNFERSKKKKRFSINVTFLKMLILSDYLFLNVQVQIPSIFQTRPQGWLICINAPPNT